MPEPSEASAASATLSLGLVRRLAGPVAVAALAIGALLPAPRGALLVPLAAALLWPWPARVERELERHGLALRLRRPGALALLVAAVPLNLVGAGQLDGHLVYGGDFKTYYIGALVGLEHGWSNLYDTTLQRAAWDAVGGPRVEFLPFLNVPLQAWLVAPLVHGYLAAYVTWVTLMLMAMVLAVILLAPASGLGRLTMALFALSLWVAAYSLASGQNAALEALSVVLVWRALRSDHEVLAGLAMTPILLRPDATVLVPVAVLLAGHWRAFVAWLLPALALAAVSLASIGPAAVGAFLALAGEVQREHPLAHQMTIRQVLGVGPLTVAVQVALTGLALAAARRARAAPAQVIACGVLASLFAAVYLHQQDYLAVLALLGCLFAEAGRRAAATPSPGFGPGWGLGLVVIAGLALSPPGWVTGDAYEPLLLAFELLTLAWLARVSPGTGRPVARGTA